MTQARIAKYQAHTNIALIKYWGKRNQELILPVTSSLSLTLEAFYTQTKVEFSDQFAKDQFILNGHPQSHEATTKVSHYVDLFRRTAGIILPVKITSDNYVPTAAGLASSASAFAALACACNDALDLNLNPHELSIMARQGSGSASRSLFGGFVEWEKGSGEDSNSSFARPFDSADWDIAMIALVLNHQSKKYSSRKAMQHTIESSPFYKLWPEEVAKDLELIKSAIKQKDLKQIGEIAEHNAMKMHATMLAANPSFTYFESDSLKAMNLIKEMRNAGLSCYYTMDAGPNVKILCPYSQSQQIKKHLLHYFNESQIIISQAGPAPFALDLSEVKNETF